MPKRENFPNLRKYSTFATLSTTAPSSIERATNILNCLGNGINSGTEIAAYCEYSVSTVHRLLQNMVELDWVVQDEISHKYFLGTLIHRLSSNVTMSHRYLVLHALKEMSRLSELTDETIILGILENLHFLKLHEIPSSHNLRIIEESDKFKGQFRGATAKVLLSQLNDRELKNLLKHIKLNGAVPNEGTSANSFLEDIKEVRKAGYSVSYGERIRGAVCASAPVKNYIYPAALYIVGPEERIKKQLKKYIEELKNSVSKVSKEIDGVFSVQGGGG